MSQTNVALFFAVAATEAAFEIEVVDEIQLLCREAAVAYCRAVTQPFTQTCWIGCDGAIERDGRYSSLRIIFLQASCVAGG